MGEMSLDIYSNTLLKSAHFCDFPTTCSDVAISRLSWTRMDSLAVE